MTTHAPFRAFRLFQAIYRVRRLDEAIAALPPASRTRLISVMTARMWIHAHLFSAILVIVMLFLADPTGDRDERAAAIALLLVGVGSLSVAVFELVTGHVSARIGPWHALRRGIFATIASLVVYAIVVLASFVMQLSSGVTELLLVIPQLAIGVALALISGADSSLLSDEAGCIADTDTRKRIEGLGNAAKYFGVAIAASGGCAVFSLAVWCTGGLHAAAGWSALVFVLSIIPQVLALRALEHTRPAVRAPAGDERALSNAWRYMLDPVSSHAHDAGTKPPQRRTFLHPVLALGLVEGCILFATAYFGLEALEELYNKAQADRTLWPLVLAPVIVLAIELIGSYGARQYATRPAPEDNGHRHSSSDWFRDVLVVLVIVAALFALHLFCSRIPGADTAGWSAGLAVVFYAVFKALRTFSVSQLRATVMASLPLPQAWMKTPILSIANACSRGFHVAMALMYFVLIFSLRRTETPGPQIVNESVAASAVLLIVLGAAIASAAHGLRERAAKPRPSTQKIYTRIQMNSVIACSCVFFVGLILANLLAHRQANLFESAHGSRIEFNMGSVSYAIATLALIVLQVVAGSRVAIRVYAAGAFTYLLTTVGVVVLLLAPPAIVDSGHSGDMTTQQQSLAALQDLINANLIDHYLEPLLRWSLPAFLLGQLLGIWLLYRLTSILGPSLKTAGLRIVTVFVAAQGIDSVIYVGAKHLTTAHTAGWWLDEMIGTVLAKWLLLVPLVLLAVLFRMSRGFWRGHRGSLRSAPSIPSS